MGLACVDIVIHLNSPIPLGAHGVCVALGMFDGVHLGHQHVVRQAWLDARALGARSVAVTFDPHPQSIVAPERAPKLLQPLAERVRFLSELGLDAILVCQFDESLSRVSGEQFIRNLARGFGQLRSFTVGEGFRFGHRRSGDVDLLRRLAVELNYTMHAAAPIRIGDEIVSSTRIRGALRVGNLGMTTELLGRPYTLAGPVQPGDRLGRKLGFPTANLAVEGLELPPHGVYAVRARVQGNEWLGALNLGQRPTVAGLHPPLRCEIHLLDFAGDIYGQNLVVEFAARLRDEQRFDGVEALRAQIARDIDAVRRLLA